LILLLLVVVLEVVNCDDGNDDSDEKKINGKNFEWGQFDKIPILCHDCPENRTFVLVTSEKICFKISKMPTDTYLSYLDFRPAGVNFSISIIHFEKKTNISNWHLNCSKNAVCTMISSSTITGYLYVEIDIFTDSEVKISKTVNFIIQPFRKVAPPITIESYSILGTILIIVIICAALFLCCFGICFCVGWVVGHFRMKNDKGYRNIAKQNIELQDRPMDLQQEQQQSFVPQQQPNFVSQQPQPIFFAPQQTNNGIFYQPIQMPQQQQGANGQQILFNQQLPQMPQQPNNVYFQNV